MLPYEDSAEASPPGMEAQSDVEARSAFGRGREAYEQGSFGEALAHYEHAYSLSRRPELLFNIGRASEADGQVERAMQAYRAYLEALPTAANHAFVRSLLAKLEGGMKSKATPLTAPTPAPASTLPSSEPAEASVLMKKASRALAAKRWDEARSLFRRAHALSPSAESHRGLGVSEFELRNYAESVAELEQALRSPVRPLVSSLRAEIEQLLARAHGFVGQVTIETRPPATELRMDGAPRIMTEKPLTLNVGDHVLEAVTPGYAREQRNFSVQGGERKTVTIVFAQPLRKETDTQATNRRHWHRSPWLWGAVGALVAGGVTAGILASQQGGTKVAAPFAGNVPGVKGP
jgi:hypothetical protein